MPGKFLGKWTIYLGSAGALSGYASYTPAGDGCMCATPLSTPDKTVHVAFILRDDGKLCFQLNNGQSLTHKDIEVGGGEETVTLTVYAFKNTIIGAVDFSFPGQDIQRLPTTFTTQLKDGGSFVIVQPGNNSSVFCEYWQPFNFVMTQVTPPLAMVQTAGKGDGLDFAWVDLTGGTLSNISLIGADFSHCDLTNFKFTTCTLKKALLNDCSSMTGADLSGSNLTGANLNNTDLRGVVIRNPLPHFYTGSADTPPSPDEPRPTFDGAKLNQSLLAYDWSRLDLRGATIENLFSPVSSATNRLQAKHSLLTGLNKNNLSDLKLQYAVFDNAVLDSVNLNGADLSNASFIQASMHGTVLSDATLKNATMTGAQLGTLSTLFTLPDGFETHFSAESNADPAGALREHFAQHEVTLSANATLDTLAPERFWEVNDLDNNITYTVRLEGDSSKVLTVYRPAAAASLVNAYMPDAILTGANLFGITANNIQFYGSKAKFDSSAILEEAKLNSSNLSRVNFTQAHLMGVNLSNCQLFNAKFNKAILTPSAHGGVGDLSNSNLQGADFTDARLDAANLTNAAVSINVPTTINPKQGGVYLFSLPYNGDTNTLQQYTAELATAANRFILPFQSDTTTLQQYIAGLNTNNVALLRTAFLRQQPPIVLTNPQIKVIELNTTWQIVDGTKSYSLWTAPDRTATLRLYVAPSLLIMQAGFKFRNLTLRWQTSTSIDTAGQQWLLDNDSQNPLNFSTGYVTFIVKLNGTVLDVYGTSLRIIRLGDQGKEEFSTEPCLITTLSQTNMDAFTICPNGATLKVNQDRTGKTWDTLWLRAATPPRPPDCVPTDFQWCASQKITKQQ